MPTTDRRDTDLTGVLFTATDKPSDTHPDYSGRITIDGRTYRLAAWRNEAQSGTRYLRLSATPIDTPETTPNSSTPTRSSTQTRTTARSPNRTHNPTRTQQADDDDVPF